MATIKIEIGCVETDEFGKRYDFLRDVEFEGTELASVSARGHDENGDISDLTGLTQTLYHAGGRYILHQVEWSKTPDQTSVYSVREISQEELSKNGYWRLARAAGMLPPLTLDEGLELVI